MAMAASARYPGFESLGRRFSPFSPFLVEQAELHQTFTTTIRLLNYLELNVNFHDAIKLISLDA